VRRSIVRDAIISMSASTSTAASPLAAAIFCAVSVSRTAAAWIPTTRMRDRRMDPYHADAARPELAAK
jgi:hypothetical protein